MPRVLQGDPLYQNSLASPMDIAGRHMAGDDQTSSPRGRLRPPEERQDASIIHWCSAVFVGNTSTNWGLYPLHEPGLAIPFLAAAGRQGESILDPSLAVSRVHNEP